jgi:hypothetical protein
MIYIKRGASLHKGVILMNPVNPVKRKRCFLIDVVFELGLSTLLGAIIIGKVAIPNLLAVSTSGWDAYSVLVWGVGPLVVVSAWMMAIIYHVKYQAWPFMR